MTRVFITVVLALLAVTAKGWAGELAVIEGYAPKSLTPTASSAAVYFTISNTGTDDRIIAIASPVARDAMIHESRIVNDVATMDMLDSLAVPAGSTLRMAPGGLHIMLTGLTAPLKEGEMLSLVVTFEKAGAMMVQVPVTGLIAPTP